MKSYLLLVVSLLAAVPAGIGVAQNDMSDVQIEAVHVAGNIHMLKGAGGNIGVSVGDDGILIVDDQFAPLARKIRSALQDLGSGELRFILNTHFHGDHIGCNPEFGKEATIIAHDNVRTRLSTPQELWGQTREPISESGWPVITFEKSLSVYFNGEEIKVMHVPVGHTDGDAMVYFTRSNVLHMGDQLFSGLFPFVDLEHGGTLDGYIKNLKMVLDKLPADVRIIPGHGPLSSMNEVKESYDMIIATVAYIRDKMAAGKGLEVLKDEGLPEKWAKFDWSFIGTGTWIETIYRSYAK